MMNYHLLAIKESFRVHPQNILIREMLLHIHVFLFLGSISTSVWYSGVAICLGQGLVIQSILYLFFGVKTSLNHAQIGIL